MAIKNFVQLQSNVATSGLPLVSEFKEIADAGYDIVINLAMPDHKDAIENEGAIVTGLGMRYVHLPVEWAAPKAEDALIFCELLRLNARFKIWAHCMLNYRVSAFMFHYLTKVEGLGAEAARSPMFEEWEPNDVWDRFLSLSAEEIGLE